MHHSTSPKLFIIATTLDIDSGGIARSAPALAKAVADAGLKVTLLAPNCERRTTDELDMTGVELDWVAGQGSLAKRLDERLGQTSLPVVVHHPGVWTLANRAVAVVAHRRSVPLVVSPRGMLDPWALRYHAWRKRLAWWAYARRALQKATLIHATSNMEADAVRATGIKRPVVVVPNGVMLPCGDKVWTKHPTRRRALFLSRLNPKKGLPMLLEAWGRARPPGWELMIAGPEDGTTRASLQELAAKLGISDQVNFAEAVDDREKWACYRSADLFVLPTLAENFGMVVAEALATEVPVLTTTAAPWAGLQEHRCGWWVAPEAESLAKALTEATRASPEMRAEMGARGRQWVTATFSWPAMGRRMAEVYRGLV